VEFLVPPLVGLSVGVTGIYCAGRGSRPIVPGGHGCLGCTSPRWDRVGT